MVSIVVTLRRNSSFLYTGEPFALTSKKEFQSLDLRLHRRREDVADPRDLSDMLVPTPATYVYDPLQVHVGCGCQC